VTAHRTFAGGPLRNLPELKVGAHVLVHHRNKVLDYVVTGTQRISVRSAASLALQSAPVPGHPGQRPRVAMITLSTCATPEDHAAGNFWTDAFGNPEHRIDKIAVLVAVRVA
jgi:sortase A